MTDEFFVVKYDGGYLRKESYSGQSAVDNPFKATRYLRLRDAQAFAEKCQIAETWWRAHYAIANLKQFDNIRTVKITVNSYLEEEL